MSSEMQEAAAAARAEWEKAWKRYLALFAPGAPKPDPVLLARACLECTLTQITMMVRQHAAAAAKEE